MMMDDLAATRRSLLAAVAGSSLLGQSVAQQAGAGGARDIAKPMPAAHLSALLGAIATPAQFGARGDDRTDDTASLQACIDTGLPVLMTAGRYRISRALQLHPGQLIAGIARTGSTTGAALINEEPDGGGLWYTQDASNGRQPMPTIINLSVTADHPIRFNDPERARISDGAGSNIPYGVRPQVRDCVLVARRRGTGIGIAWSKMFDGSIEGCEIEGFSINLLLQGCDINTVRNNRSVLASRYHILDLSVGTFGSQNVIEHNDILQAGGSGCIFIKSTGRHARIRDNYLEHAAADAAYTPVDRFTGFIDASAVDTPRFGANGDGQRFTTVIVNNRIDGMKHAVDFVYRYQPFGQTWGEIVDGGTTGEALQGATALKLVDGKGQHVDAVPFLYNEINASAFVFQSPAFGRWNGYRSRTSPGMHIDGETCGMFGSGLSGDHADQFVLARGTRIAIRPGLIRAQFTFDPHDERFVPGHRYRYVIIARVTNGQETLTIGQLSGLAGSGGQSFALTPRFACLTYDMVVPAAGDRQGIYLTRGGGSHDIEIERIEIRKQFVDELPRTERASAMLTLTGREGEIVVEADDGEGRRATVVYRIIGDDLQPLLSCPDKEGRVAIRANWNAPNLGVALSGPASRKAIHIGRRLG
jgi:hypothetical protein